MTEIMRQGDVLLKKIKSLPKNLTPKDNVLALGEVTGHSHRMVGPVEVMIATDGQQYIMSQGQTQLIHEEHETLDIPKGNYLVVRQREYDLLQGIRRVAD